MKKLSKRRVRRFAKRLDSRGQHLAANAIRSMAYTEVFIPPYMREPKLRIRIDGVVCHLFTIGLSYICAVVMETGWMGFVGFEVILGGVAVPSVVAR